MANSFELMLITVGGSPDPVINSIRHYQPQKVYFFASQESVEIIPAVKAALAAGGSPQFKDIKVMIEDINDVTGCYRRMLECAEDIERDGIPASEVLADFTGGTKVMSAALMMAASLKGYRLNYTGGGERTRNGSGTVISGSEQPFLQINPWEALALENRQRAIQMFNSYHYAAAASLFAAAAEKTADGRLKKYLSIMQKLAEAYAEWDKFRHIAVVQRFSALIRDLKAYVELLPDAGAISLLETVSLNWGYLQKFSQDSYNFKNVCTYHVLDLLANARRRAEEGKYDDAVARLYRVLEMIEQVEFKEKYNLDTARIPLSDKRILAAVLRIGNSFHKEKYFGNQSDTLKLPCAASYQMLAALDSELGKKYLAVSSQLEDLLSARNNSILAHGQNPLDKDTFEKFWQLILQFSRINLQDLPQFPRLEIPYV
ncbi:MAG: TIGR02710 family CRISPR-associated CARF protein [Dehalococcoidales bacterium]|nr:TIGR02710 family CRISPR-associated CARF protein [Dehalococcoidales bacterium]